jgi:FkbH-like protein
MENPIMTVTFEDFVSQQKSLLDEIRLNPSHRNYWNAFQRIKSLIKDNDDIKSKHDFNIALLSSFTIDPLAAYIDIDSRLIGLFPHVYVGPFNQYAQEILNSESKLYKYNPQMIFLCIQLETLVDSMFLVNFPKMTLQEKESEINRVYDHITSLLESLMQRTNALLILSNFVIPSFSPFGILDNKQELGYKKFYKVINDKLEHFAKEKVQLFIYDLNTVASDFGKDHYINYPMYYRGSFLFADQFLQPVSYEILGYIKALKGKNRKALVLDLDNTLWGGVIGEEGINGIKLNMSYPGNDFVDFQKIIMSLHNRGIILAVNSKNDASYALEVFQKHPFMLIKEKNLGAYKINWLDKATNIINLAKELDIGIDSLVFLDDNPVERERVRTSAPEVLTVDLPNVSALYKKTLEKLNDFNSLTLTNEDLHRGEMYYARRKRQDLETTVQSMDEFIKSLELQVIIKKVDSFSLPRVTSLINKTNQFNLTTKRYTEIEVQKMSSDSTITMYTLQVKDKYGDEGLVGVAITKINESELIIDNILMSCRVIGRKVETTFLTKILIDAKEKGVTLVKGTYIPTKKNGLVKDFFSNHHFSKNADLKDGGSIWSLNTDQIELQYPNFIQIVED